MSWRTVVISSSAKLDYQMGYLIVRNQDVVKIHISEISILMIETTSVSLTAALLCELTKKKIKVVFCDEKRNPSSELIPYYGSHDTSMKVRKQIAWSEDIKTSVWTEIVTEKIRKQAENLERWDRTEAQMLYEYITQIEFGDATNREGHAAKVYFNALFGLDFTRTAENSINAALNYGYSLLLSTCARETALNGYITQIGLFHDNIFNQFNLASDLMEPFRPIVDNLVKAEELQKRGYKLYSVAPMPLLLYLLKKEMVVSAAEPSTQLLLSECRKSIAKSIYGAGKTAASTAVKAAGTARKISFLSTAAGKAVIGIVATASIASAVTVGVISYNKSNDKNATVQENVPAVEEVPVNADQPIDGVGEDTETTDAPEDENGSEKYADIPESVLPSSVRNDKDYFEFWDEPVKATCWIDGVKGTIYADWDKTQIIKEVTYDVDGYEDELLIIGCTLDGGTHAIAIYNGQYVVVNDAMWDHWYNGKSSAFD